MNSTQIPKNHSGRLRFGMLTAAAALLGLATSANAGLIAYDGFDYPAGGTSLNTLNGGVGWATAWDNGGWRTPSAGWSENEATLSYSTLTVGGTSARAGSDYDQSFRQFAPQAATGTYWISLVMKVDSADAANPNSLGLSLFDGGSEKNFLGKAGSANWSVAGEGANASAVPISGNTNTLILARYNMDTGVAHFWLNPTLGGAEPTNASAFNGAAGTAFTAFSFDRVRLGRFGANGYIDEFRLGTTFSDVAPFTPEFFAYEGFDYMLGASLNTENGGTGWTTAWDDGGWRTPSTDFGENDSTLAYSTLIVGGTSARAANNYSQSYRQFAPQTATGTYWISLVMNVDGDDAASAGALGLSLFDGGTERNFLGKASSANWSVAGAGANDSGVAISGNTDTFILARYNMDTGVAHFWLDPTIGGAAPTDASAFNGAAGTAFTPFSFDRIRLGRFDANGYIDEFRIGKNYASVAPSSEAPSSELANFRSSNGLAADGSQDLLTPANDSVTNLMKYACNMIGAGAGQAATLSIANVSGFNGSAGLPLVGKESGTGKLTLTYLRRKASGSPAPGVTYSVQFGSTLADFAVNGSATEVATSIDATFESVVVTDSVLPPGKRFARLQVTAP